MKNATQVIQTALLAALCVIGVMIFMSVREEPVDPGQALAETLGEWP